ncbi:MAG: transcriptional repressor LexA, partial [Bacteroidetes bacterium]|nr:transcriptional repressor LexA [Bacteroidota bacterium]
MQTLTKKQKQVFDFIDLYIRENGVSPTIDEIRKKLKLKAVSTIHEHINALKEKGYISKSDNLSRSIETNKENFKIIEIPIMGTIAAGYPIEAIEDRQDTISIINSSIKSPKDYYALRVQGDSMIEEGIFNGDIVIIKKQSVAENGQTVVAIIDDNEATLKKLYREKNKFRLEPRNQSMLPFYRKEVEIRGVVVQIISNPKIEEEIKIQKKTKHGFKTIDLFAGIGGIRMGFENAGFKTAFANDFDAPCKQTYDLNFKDSKLVVEDIRKLGIDDLPE